MEGCLLVRERRSLLRSFRFEPHTDLGPERSRAVTQERHNLCGFGALLLPWLWLKIDLFRITSIAALVPKTHPPMYFMHKYWSWKLSCA